LGWFFSTIAELRLADSVFNGFLDAEDHSKIAGPFHVEHSKTTENTGASCSESAGIFDGVHPSAFRAYPRRKATMMGGRTEVRALVCVVAVSSRGNFQ
jgi:hypothetical protein